MKSIGIIGAMDNEIALLLEQMSNGEMTEKASMKFYKGYIAEKPVIVVKSGIGKVNAAACAQILVDVFDVGTIINTGIAGGLKGDIKIGDIVLSTDVVHHDMDAVGFGYPKGQIPQMETFSFPADRGLLELAKHVCAEVCPDNQVFEGRIASGDQFVSSREVKEEILRNVGGYAVEMEGAAIGQTAYLNGVPFLIVRSISDNADDHAGMDYETFEKLAVKNSATFTGEMIRRL